MPAKSAFVSNTNHKPTSMLFSDKPTTTTPSEPHRRLKEFAKLAALVLLTYIVIQWWRKPHEPDHFAQRPLQTLSHRNITLNQLSQNQVALVYFWGTWCGYCKYTSPTIERLRADGIPVLSVALNSGDDDQVRRYMQQHNLHFETVNDPDGSLAKEWHLAVTPTTIVLKNGRLSNHVSGLSSYWDLRARIFLADWL